MLVIFQFLESSKVWKKPKYNSHEINVLFLIYVNLYENKDDNDVLYNEMCEVKGTLMQIWKAANIFFFT